MRKKKKSTMADWDSVDRVVKQIHGWTFSTLARAFQTLDWAFDFLLRPQKLGRMFAKLCWAFERLCRVF